MRKIPIVITAYCEGTGADVKKQMVHKLCEKLSKSGHYICLATHSPLSVEIQNFCDGYIYDSDNDFHINGIPVEGRNHAIAEMKSIHNALNYLDRFGFTEFFKLTFDCDPEIPYNTIIERAQDIVDNHGKEFVCSGWGNEKTLGALVFYSTFDFFRTITSLDAPEKMKSCFEVNWFLVAEEKKVLDKVHMCHVRLYDDYLGYPMKDYAHQGGTELDHYPYQ
jgi:hypothetical protein